MPFPENLLACHAHSEGLRQESIALIEASKDLSFHAQAIERTANLFHMLGHDGDVRNDDDRIIRVLGFRGANDILTSVDLILGGYYQPAMMIARDLLELNFLMDDFSADKTLIEKWRTLDPKQYRDTFQPVAVRKRLDERDGLTGKKRAESYQLISSVAGHPSPAGFQMLLRSDGNYHDGPFVEPKTLDACWSELAKIAVQVGGHYQEFFGLRSKMVVTIKAEFLELQNDWMEHFFGKAPFEKTKIEEIWALARSLPGDPPAT